MSCVKVVKVEVGVLGFPTSLLNNPAYGLRGRKATDLGRGLGWGRVGWGVSDGLHPSVRLHGMHY